MLKKKLGKKALAFASAAVMAVSATATGLTALSMTAFAGEELGEGTFENGKGLPWHICENATAVMKFDITDGIYAIKLENIGGTANGGESRWDCQFRHRNLTIESGHTYRITYSVNPSNSGHMYAKLGNMSKDDQELWHSNGDELSLSYEAGLTQTQLEDKLKSASKTGNKVDYGQGWDAWYNKEYPANEWTTVAYEFQATETVKGTAEWTFHMGGQGNYAKMDCFPKDTIIRFDNLALIDMTDDASDYQAEASYEPTGVEVNQVGYYSNRSKQASLINAKGGESFSVLDSSGKEVYTGTASAAITDPIESSGETVAKLDFTELTTPGTYTIKCGSASSFEFTISDDIYDGLLTNALNYYYQNRSGVNIEEKYITSYNENPKYNQTKAGLAHKGGHNPDKAYVQSEWVKSYAGEFDGDTTYSIDGTGGWYDAGDHGKYVVNGGISIWTLQNMYEMSLATDKASKFDDGGEMVIPEGSNSKPDILDETKVELDWFFKMIVDSKDPYWGKYEGLVYHKLHDHKWTGLACRPNDYEETWGTTRIVKPPSYAATLNLVACAAQAARLWEGIDDAYAKECLDNAEKCYAAVKKYWKEYSEASDKDNPTSLYAPLDQAIGGGAYGDTEVKDDLYWAACELYATTGDSKYYDDLSNYKDKFKVVTYLEGGENKGSFSSFNWGCTGSLGSLSLYLSDKVSDADKAKIADSITEAADTYIAQEEKEGFGIPYEATTFTDDINIGPGIKITGYEWGSNSFVANNAIVMAYAYNSTGDAKYIDGVTTAMDYIFGTNALDFSYVTGYGSYYCQRPHHRLWSYELDKNFPMAPKGVMSGGPGSGMQDPYIGGLGYKRGTLAAQKCYVDSIEAWSVNEVTINWNAPLAWVTSFLDDFGNDEGGSSVTKPSSGKTDPTSPDVTVSLYGDANCDGKVDISDAVLIKCYLLNSSSYPISAQGLANSDVQGNKNGVNAQDAVTIQKYILKAITSLPV